MANLFALCRDGAVKPEGQATPNRAQRMLAFYAEVRRSKSLQSRIKAESGKLLVFDFRLECENGPLRLSRGQMANLFALCRDGAVKPEGQATPNRAQRMLAFYAEVRRSKSLQSRIKAENFFSVLYLCLTVWQKGEKRGCHDDLSDNLKESISATIC